MGEADAGNLTCGGCLSYAKVDRDEGPHMHMHMHGAGATETQPMMKLKHRAMKKPAK
jgi:hypothetical protein